MAEARAHGRRLRILHLSESYPPLYGGGAAIYVQDLCRLLAARGHAVRALSTTDQGPPYSLSDERDGPGLRCLLCMYSHYDGPAVAVAKLPWRLVRLGAYPAYRLWRRRRARETLRAAVGYSRFMAEVHGVHLRAPVAHVHLGIALEG